MGLGFRPPVQAKGPLSSDSKYVCVCQCVNVLRLPIRRRGGQATPVIACEGMSARAMLTTIDYTGSIKAQERPKKIGQLLYYEVSHVRCFINIPGSLFKSVSK